MEIRSVLSSVYKNDDKLKAPSGKQTDAVKKDKIEISSEAKALKNSGDVKNLEEIQKRIESGFYNTDAVISKVADAIIKEIGK